MVQRPYPVRRGFENLAFHDAEAEAQHDVEVRVPYPLHVLRAEAIDESHAQRLDTEQVGLSHERCHVGRFERVGALAAETLVVGRLIPLPQPVGRRGALPPEPLAPRGGRRLLLGGVHDDE